MTFAAMDTLIRFFPFAFALLAVVIFVFMLWVLIGRRGR